MYLYAERYVPGWSHTADENREKFNAITELAGFGGLVSEEVPSVTVRVCVAYWRKANAIHAWFVENVQGGVDECQYAHVGRDQLQVLRDQCYELVVARNADALSASTLASARLPTRSGFFFGSTEIDDYYWSDLEHTANVLRKILTTPALEGCDFQYHSSW
jgi:hypothetical protein